MKNSNLTIHLLLLFAGILIARSINGQKEQKAYQHAVSLGTAIPIDVFGKSHIAGISGSYSWSHYRFGKLTSTHSKTLGFIANGGIDYYFGKSVKTAGYSFKYGNYLYSHLFGGLLYNLPARKQNKEYASITNLSLLAGPTLGVYKGNADAGYGITLKGSYYATENFAITPGILYMKHALVNTLWALTIQGSYNF